MNGRNLRGAPAIVFGRKKRHPETNFFPTMATEMYRPVRLSGHATGVSASSERDFRREPVFPGTGFV
jgi:hypothetical protein